MLSRWIFLPVILLLSIAAHADVYKWKDSNGVIRYSDVPPNNQPYEALNNKKIAPSAATNGDVPPPSPGAADQQKINREIAAEKRRADANKSKADNENKAAANKAKLENCQNAKANLANYQQGGRVYKMNADGEREYLDDDALEKAAANAQKDVDKYCN